MEIIFCLQGSAVPQSSQNLCPNCWLHFSGVPALYSLVWASLTDVCTHVKCQACCCGSHKLCMLREGELRAEGDSKALTSVTLVWSHSKRKCRAVRVTRINPDPIGSPYPVARPKVKLGSQSHGSQSAMSITRHKYGSAIAQARAWIYKHLLSEGACKSSLARMIPV